MNQDIILIIQACDTIHEIKQELSKPSGFLKFGQKKEYKKLKGMVKDKIEELANVEWTIPYLFSLQITLRAYKSKLEPYMANVYISEEDEAKNDPSVFSTMYFTDIEKNNQIILDIISDNITFTVFDNNTGNSFSASSKDVVQQSQKKIESVCKQRLVEMLEEYCDERRDLYGNL